MHFLKGAEQFRQWPKESIFTRNRPFCSAQLHIIDLELWSYLMFSELISLNTVGGKITLPSFHKWRHYPHFSVVQIQWPSEKQHSYSSKVSCSLHKLDNQDCLNASLCSSWEPHSSTSSHPRSSSRPSSSRAVGCCQWRPPPMPSLPALHSQLHCSPLTMRFWTNIQSVFMTSTKVLSWSSQNFSASKTFAITSIESK